MQPRLSIIAASIRRILTSGFVEPTSDPYLDNVVLSLRMESSDPYYNQKVLGLHCDGTNGSTTITDVKGKTATLAGNVQISTAQYPSLTGKSSSLYFDGTGDYATYANSTDWEFGSGDFTVRLWCRPASAQLDYMIQRGSATGYTAWALYWNGTNSKFGTDGSTTGSSYSWAVYSTSTYSLDTWHLVELVRSGTTIYLLVDGVLEGTATSVSGSLMSESVTMKIGANSAGTNAYTGYMSEIEIYKGVALHTKNYSIASAPFPEPANTAIDDTGKTVTTVGGAQFSGVSKYGSGSFYFDGTGDYLTVPDSDSWNFATSEFTMEAWIYPTAYPTSNNGQYSFGIIAQDATSDRSFAFLILGTASSLTSLYFIGCSDNTTGYTDINANKTFNLNTWYHVAAVRSGNLVYLFVDGICLNPGGTAFSRNIQNSTTTLKIGAYEFDATYKYYFSGYIDDLRITKGVARYTSNFTPYKILTTAPAGDPLYNYTTLLLKMNGTNGGTTFTDNSYSPKTATPDGNTNTSTAQLKYGTASGYFDGVGDSISFATSTDWNLGAGDFTMEAWIRYETTSNTDPHIACLGDSGGTIEVRIKLSSTRTLAGIIYHTSAYQVNISGTTVLDTGTWYHVAFVRYGNVHSIYLNGVLEATATVSHTIPTGTILGYIGRVAGSALDVYRFKGYIDDVRLTKGFARYTSSFQTPGPHIAAIDPDTDQWWLNTVLALRMDGTHGSTTFTDLKGKTVTAYGNASISSAVSKFGQAGYFDGTTDGMSIPSSTDFDFGSGDYTLECWINLNATTTTQLFIRRSAATWAPFSLYVDGTGLGLSGSTTGSSSDIAITGTTAVSTGVWHHAALTRYGNVYTLWLDGTACGTTTISGALMASTSPVYIGCDFNQSSSINGYLDDVRITKGIARYTAAFTPSEKPLPTYVVGPDHDQYWDKVVLANSFDSSLTDSRNNVGTAYGNAAVSDTQKMFGNSSAYFDGTGDYITYPDSTDWDFTTSFTIEFWCYVTAFDTDGTLFIMQQSGATYGGFEFYADQYGTVYFRRSDTLLVVTSATGILTAGSWKHLAATWDGTTYRVFVDGIIVGSGSSASAPANVTGVLRIGTYVSASTYDLNGYIDGLRITKGVARYTADFELPTKANILG